MKVFYSLPSTNAQQQQLVKALRAAGLDVRASEHKDPDNYMQWVKKAYDVYHFHEGLSINRSMEDFRCAENQNKVRLMHYWGYDIRDKELATIHNPYVLLVNQFQDSAVIKKGLEASKHIPACIVPDFEMVPYAAKAFDRIYVLPYAVDEAKKKKDHQVQNQDPLIVYSSRYSYESEWIADIAKRLLSEGNRFRIVNLFKKSVEEISAALSHADVAIDQIMLGAYTPFAVEAMAFGVPVISYIREDLRSRYPSELPVISANPSTIYEKLKKLLNDASLRRKQGAAGPAYMNKYHDSLTIGSQLQWIYRNEARLLADNPSKKGSPVVYHLLRRDIKRYSIDPGTRHVSHKPVSQGQLPPGPGRYQSLLEWAQKTNVYKEIYPGSSSISFTNSPDSKKSLGAYKNAAVAIMEEGRVWGNHGSVLSPENTLLWDVSVEWTNPGKYSIFSVNTLPPLKNTADTIGVLAHIGGNGFFHWMFSVLPRFHLIQKSGIAVDKFVVNPCQSPYQTETLQMLGIRKEQIIEASPALHIQSKQLVIPTLPGNVTGWACHFLKTSLVSKKPTSGPKYDKVYISRKKASWRKVINEAELVEKLKPLGFHSVELETLTMKEQIQLFSTARFIVSPHGAGLSNLVFCNPGAKVIELFAPRYLIPTYTVISYYAGLDYHYLICRDSSGDKLLKNSWSGADDIRVDIPALLQVMGKLKP